MHKNSMRLMKEFVEKHFDKDSPFTLLDVGGKNINGSYKELMPTNCIYDCMDMSIGKGVTIVCPEPYNWKEILDESYDVVISGQCMEHVPQPWVWIKEIHRVVKKGGLVIILAPWTWKPHYYPLDCWRVLPDGMSGLFDYAGFEMIETNMSDNDTYGIGVKI